MKDLGNKPVMASNIKRFMREKGINAKELSRALGVPYTTVLSWCKAEYYPRIDKVERMAEYFGILKSDLIEDKKEPTVADDGLSKEMQELIDRLKALPEDKIQLLLQVAKSIE